MLTDTSVISPYGSSARSWRRPQASRTALYLMRTTRGNLIRDNDHISLIPIVITGRRRLTCLGHIHSQTECSLSATHSEPRLVETRRQTPRWRPGFPLAGSSEAGKKTTGSVKNIQAAPLQIVAQCLCVLLMLLFT